MILNPHYYYTTISRILLNEIFSQQLKKWIQLFLIVLQKLDHHTTQANTQEKSYEYAK
jgi:hypothetical protein